MTEVTDRMVEAAMSAWLKCPDFSSGTYNAMRAGIEAALREQALQALSDIGQKIDAMPDVQAEPVAWADPDMLGILTSDERDALIRNQGSADDYTVPLYTHPPQRKPLTEEQIAEISVELAASHQHTDVAFARAIERAHGIGGKE